MVAITDQVNLHIKLSILINNKLMTAEPGNTMDSS